MTLDEALRLRREDPARATCARARRVDRGPRRGDGRRSRSAGAHTFDYGNNIRAEAKEAGFADAFDFPGFVPAYIRPLFCRGNGPFRWAALSGDPQDIAVTDAALLERSRKRDRSRRWIRWPARRSQFQGLPCAHLLARLRRARRGRRALQRARAHAARSRRRSSSAATTSTPARWRRPYRETEGMMDGSDAIADWPILNALLNTAAGASWVRSITAAAWASASASTPAWSSSPTAPTRWASASRRVLTTDPGTGVMRHADAGLSARRSRRRGSPASTCRWWRPTDGGAPRSSWTSSSARPAASASSSARTRSSTVTSWGTRCWRGRRSAASACSAKLHCPDFAIEVRRRGRKPRASRPPEARRPDKRRRSRRTTSSPRRAARSLRTKRAATMGRPEMTRSSPPSSRAPSCCRATRPSLKAPSPPARASSPAIPSRRPPRSPRCSRRRLPEVGGTFIQMEDEIASIAAVCGASLAGAKALTATSGPGFSLMQEMIGFATMAQIPCVVVDVMRGGPSTACRPSPPRATSCRRAGARTASTR